MTFPEPNERAEHYRAEYSRRVNRAVDFISANLSREVSLDELAAVACFSRFHFHRVFKAVTGETVGQFVLRLRLQRAAELLIYRKIMNVTAICFDCGFSDTSVFSRSFRQRYGESPSRFRHTRRAGVHIGQCNASTEESNHDHQGGTHGQAIARVTCYPSWTDPTPTWTMTMKKYEDIKVTIEEIPDLLAACVRHVGPYQEIPEAFGRLYAWTGPRGLCSRPDAMGFSIYYDAPETTEPSNLRSDACMTVPEGTKGDGPVEVRRLGTKGRYALGRFEFDGPEGFQDAWNSMMAVWLPQSGFQCDDRPCLEVYRNDCSGGYFVVDICIPVRPL